VPIRMGGRARTDKRALQSPRAERSVRSCPERMALPRLAWASAWRLCWRVTPTDHWRTGMVGRVRARCWPPRRRWSGSYSLFFSSLLCLTAGSRQYEAGTRAGEPSAASSCRRGNGIGSPNDLSFCTPGRSCFVCATTPCCCANRPFRPWTCRCSRSRSQRAD